MGTTTMFLTLSCCLWVILRRLSIIQIWISVSSLFSIILNQMELNQIRRFKRWRPIWLLIIFKILKTMQPNNLRRRSRTQLIAQLVILISWKMIKSIKIILVCFLNIILYVLIKIRLLSLLESIPRLFKILYPLKFRDAME